jgi:plasmid stabilization system protein ParE
MRICVLACEAFPVGESVIIYRIDGEDVAILRVVRGSRNSEALFGH